VIARETLSADAQGCDAKCYGGERLAQTQTAGSSKGGKKDLPNSQGRHPQEAFISALKNGQLRQIIRKGGACKRPFFSNELGQAAHIRGRPTV